MHLEGNCRWVSLTHVDLLNFLHLFTSYVMNGCFKTYLFTPTKQQINIKPHSLSRRQKRAITTQGFLNASFIIESSTLSIFS